MQDDYNVLIGNKTWKLVPCKTNANIIRSFWIFKHKMNYDDSFVRHKAQLVGDGVGQQTGIDCGDTFSLVVKPTTIHRVLSFALSKSLCLHQLDVKKCFSLWSPFEDYICTNPPGFRDPQHLDHICLLKKSSFGLKQHLDHIKDLLTLSMGFTHSISDNSIYLPSK